jgi:glycosyltransferase involved in cell wall biosynthesis
VRKELGIPASRCIVAYAGHFKTCGEKGIATLLDALTMAPSGSLVGLLIGGKPGEIADYQNRFPNAPVIYREWTTDALCVSRWLQSADVLVIPTSRDTLYTRYSFPMKAYDYLALGKPTVVSGLPIIREVMTEEVALTLRPGDAEGLMQALERLSSDAVLCERLGRNARDASRQYTWERRAEHILRVLQSKSL